MTDYFAHIVEQSMGVADTIRPLIQPLFASAPDVLVWDDPLVDQSDDTLQPAILPEPASESPLPVNLVAPNVAWDGPLFPGSLLLREAPSNWQREAWRDDVAQDLPLPTLSQQQAIAISDTEIASVVPPPVPQGQSVASHPLSADLLPSVDVSTLVPVRPIAPTRVEYAETTVYPATGVWGDQPEPGRLPMAASSQTVPPSSSALVKQSSAEPESDVARKPSVEPESDAVQVVMSHRLDAFIRAQIIPRQSAGVIVPMQPSGGDQLPLAPVPAMQQVTSSDVSVRLDADKEGRSHILLTEGEPVLRLLVDEESEHVMQTPVMQAPVGEEGEQVLRARVDGADRSVLHMPVDETAFHAAERVFIAPASPVVVEEQSQTMSMVEQETEHEESMPPIHVSIGRVDVRVSSPPVPPGANGMLKAAPRPALSLNDYLAQRRKGVR
jgi:hypothetical protein